MINHNKTYGFTIAVKELRETVPNIFRYASAYKRMKNLKSKGLWEMFLEEPEEPKDKPKEEKSDEKPLPDEILQTAPGGNQIEDVDPEAMEGEKYNMCHFWSNFEIARLDWFRSKEYEDFFTMMDRSGGFWMERVRYADLSGCAYMLTAISGVMLQSIHLLPVLCYHQVMFTISETLAIDIPQFNIVQPTLPHVNETVYLG